MKFISKFLTRVGLVKSTLALADCEDCGFPLGKCECEPATGSLGPAPHLDDEGFTRSGPSGYEPITPYSESHYGSFGDEGEIRDR